MQYVNAAFLRNRQGRTKAYIQLCISLKTSNKNNKPNFVPKHDSTSKQLTFDKKGLATQVIITLHDTTELQHVHNPTTVLHT